MSHLYIREMPQQPAIPDSFGSLFSCAPLVASGACWPSACPVSCMAVSQPTSRAGSTILRERDYVHSAWTSAISLSLQPAWLMRTELRSCLSLLQQGNETMADRLLVLVPHEQTYAPRSILEQAKKLGPEVTEMRAIKHTMALIGHRLCIEIGQLFAAVCGKFQVVVL